MYRSKAQIEKKLSQAKYILKEMQKFRDKIFVNNGVDPETGVHPLQVKISSFLALTRSVLQYAYKEAKEKKQITEYEKIVNKHPIIKIFKGLRDIDIHENIIGIYTTIYLKSKIPKMETHKNEKTESKTEKAKIIYQITRPLTITNELIAELRKKGQTELADAAQKGKPLYVPVEFEGETDLFVLCEKYISNLEELVSELIKKGIVT